MTFAITMHQDEDGTYVLECPAIPGCISQGATPAEAKANIRDAIRQCGRPSRAGTHAIR